MERQGVAAVARAYPLGFWLSVCVGLLLMPLVVLPVIAVTRLSRENRAAFAVLATVAGYLVVSGGGTPAASRFRVPAVPFLVLMSAFSFRAAPSLSPERDDGLDAHRAAGGNPRREQRDSRQRSRDDDKRQGIPRGDAEQQS
jgi:hypothetical protein